jgi:hypothetical protein
MLTFSLQSAVYYRSDTNETPSGLGQIHRGDERAPAEHCFPRHRPERALNGHVLVEGFSKSTSRPTHGSAVARGVPHLRRIGLFPLRCRQPPKQGKMGRRNHIIWICCAWRADFPQRIPSQTKAKLSVPIPLRYTFLCNIIQEIFLCSASFLDLFPPPSCSRRLP